MDLIFTIIHQTEDEASFIYSDNHKLAGFTYREGYFLPLSKSVIDALSKLNLGENRRFIEVRDGCEVYEDIDTGFRHFIKDGMASMEMFYLNNGDDMTLLDSLTELKRRVQRAKAFAIGVYLIFSVGYISFAPLYLNRISLDNETLYYNYLKEEGYIFEGGKIIKFDADNVLDDVKMSIQNSSNLNDEEREFLYKRELLEMATSYYNDKKSNVILHARHHNIGIVSFSESISEQFPDSDGLYCGGNSLYVRDYDIGEILNNSQRKQATTGHEYVHMLEMGTLLYIKESIAEIVMSEYFPNEYVLRYQQGVKYTKVLMEILGRDAVASEAFAFKSNSLSEAVSKLLSNEDYEYFMELMKKNPDDFDTRDNKILYDALASMYKSKFGSEMNENALIKAILEDGNYSRTYFSKKMMEEEPSYYINHSQVFFDDFCERDDISFLRMTICHIFPKWIFSNDDSSVSVDFFVSCKNPNARIDTNNVRISKDGLEGNIIIDDGESNRMYIDVQKAINQRIVTVYYRINHEITKEEFKTGFAEMQHGLAIKSLNDDMSFSYDRTSNTFEVTEKIFIEEIGSDNLTMHSL